MVNFHIEDIIDYMVVYILILWKYNGSLRLCIDIKFLKKEVKYTETDDLAYL